MSSLDSIRQQPVCPCESEEMCASIGAGHGMSPLRDRLARATPSGWLDAFVESVDGGRVELALLDGDRVRVWNHASLDTVVQPGDPVAFHPLYEVLAAPHARVSVIPL